MDGFHDSQVHTHSGKLLTELHEVASSHPVIVQMALLKFYRNENWIERQPEFF